jgi:MFS superfamily sulfate permease-like transporter
VILILKQIPHLLGHDTDPEGEMSFIQPDHENSLSELYAMLSDLHPGAAVIGLLSVALLLLWDRIPIMQAFSNSRIAGRCISGRRPESALSAWHRRRPEHSGESSGPGSGGQKS